MNAIFEFPEENFLKIIFLKFLLLSTLKIFGLFTLPFFLVLFSESQEKGKKISSIRNDSIYSVKDFFFVYKMKIEKRETNLNINILFLNFLLFLHLAFMTDLVDFLVILKCSRLFISILFLNFSSYELHIYRQICKK